MNDDTNFWWSELNHGGMFLSPAVLKEFLPDGPEKINPDGRKYLRLRDAFAAFESFSQQEDTNGNDGLYRWVRFIFDEFLAYPSMFWQRGGDVSDRFKYNSATDRLRPNWVLLDKGIADHPRFLVNISTRKGRLGMGKGRVEYSKFLTLLRGTKVQFGLLTNGFQFRLVFAGMDYDCWVEWDASRWFEEENSLSILAGFQALVGKYATYKTDEDEFPLKTAVINSRSRQGELSQVLGEQVREAVEKLLSSLDKSVRTHPDMLDSLQINPESGKEVSESESLNALYIAAIRMIMRMVVVLFAESRELLPRNMEKYHTSYGIEGLFASLEGAVRHEGEENLKHRFSAWPRLLGLFQATYEGCSNEDIPIPRYSGSLFKTGDVSSADVVLRALAVFEDDRWEINDFVVLEILRLLKIGKVRVRKGRLSTWVSGPVDFSDLRTEYIGMMYEGLLDYELKQVTDEQKAVVFLNLGQQPALPLSLLESLSDSELNNLIKKLKKEKSSSITPEEDEEESVDEIAEEMEEQEGEDGDEESEEDDVQKLVMNWAEHAVEVANLVKKKKNADQYAYNLERFKSAKNLIIKVFGPGEMYLVRWSGTRKGTGTFYTRPQLAVPTVHRTLEPLVYEKNNDELIPKSPDEILNLKVCDPAMGSGSFLVAALRYLTDGLYESLVYHKKIKDDASSGCVITLPFGEESTGDIKEELLPVNVDDERFEHMLKTRLKRHIVERCIYGVDINDLAVELARLSLWVETMDRELPFEFLSHKLKVGNSLVGCWLDQFEDYPILAWEREGGDGSKGEITKRIKSIYNDQVKPQMKKWILEMGPQKKLSAWTEEEESIETIQHENVELYGQIHELKGTEREEFFKKNIQNNEHLKQLKYAMNKWCAVWFWPVEDKEIEPLTPDQFYQPKKDEKKIVNKISSNVKFFHWELEFPDVFSENEYGFNAIIGNPPWDTLQPMSAEFFTKYDPIFRTYGNQEAKKHQKLLTESDQLIKNEWLSYLSYFSCLTNWVKNVSNPFGDPIEKNGINVILESGKKNSYIHELWRNQRKNRFEYTKNNHPYEYQGSGKAYTYKMFLDLANSIILEKGRIGMLVPSSIYSTLGSSELRLLFLNKYSWEWLFGFENRKKIFNIHGSFKFCVIITNKDDKTDSIKTAFMRHDLNDWENPDNFLIKYKKEYVKLFSPKNNLFLEINSEKEQRILEEMYSNSIPLNDKDDNGWRITFSQGDFNMTSDSKLFPPLTKWIEKDFEKNDYDRWLNPDGKIALPLYEGRMIGQFDFSEKGWVSGKGRSAVWNNIPFDEKELNPQYLIKKQDYELWKKGYKGYKVGFMDVSSATNTRSMISCLIVDMPCGNKVPLLKTRNGSLKYSLTLTALLNSFSYDFALRDRFNGNSLNYFIIEETPLPIIKKINEITLKELSLLTARLTFISKIFSPDWLRLKNMFPEINSINWKLLWAVTNHERLRLRTKIDSIIAYVYGIDLDDFKWILKEDTNDPKGFWRVDKDKPKDIRQTTLTLTAYEKLNEIGIEKFCNDDWQFSEKIQNQLGPRFLPWQLEGAPEQSWQECEMHARNILGEEKFNTFIENLTDPEKNSDNFRFSPQTINEENNRQSSLSSWSEE